ncbi:hypothetical protein OJF2_69360 [Aquisphaera giovannonii]|uniref:Uncharacterized protein n=1 Tax=Aquisphaera giovannonii TaxID=406548 RepID=A0A5B9WE48_9BACT|nr:hypothetical protein [Aquisphaera giovannonii]QEH38335.1 hypothetical protein OJF2_69360 [Aquisphaera giovannonii]
MKRFLLLLAVAILASSTAGTARAQQGSRFYDMGNEIESQRKEAKAKMRHAGGAGPSAFSLGRSSAADIYGRMDMAGHSAPGYPTIRSNVAGQLPPYMDRGTYVPAARRPAAAPRRAAATAASSRAAASQAAASKAAASSRRGSKARSAKDDGPPPLPF